jgi:hypothetical protein
MRGQGGHVSVEAFQQQELAHIERMIVELERVPAHWHGVGAHNPVMQREYWRQRIHALMNSPDVADSVARQASALLKRLAGASNGRGHAAGPRDF